MPISREKKIIFIHIPKTGGTSIEYVLGMHGTKEDIGLVPYTKQRKQYHFLYGAGLQHMTLQEISYSIRISNFSDYKLFGRTKRRIDFIWALLTDPNFKKGLLDTKTIEKYFVFTVVRNPYSRLVSHFAWLDEKWYHNTTLSISEFERYIKHSLEKGYFSSNRHLIPQYLFINRFSSVSRILYFEKLKEDFTEMCEMLNLKVTLPNRMKSNHDEINKYYTNSKLKDLIYTIYQKDFELFGYDK